MTEPLPFSRDEIAVMRHENPETEIKVSFGAIVKTWDQAAKEAREDERRRIDDLAVQRGYGDFWKVNDDPRMGCGVSLFTASKPVGLPPFTDALAAALSEATKESHHDTK